MGAEKRVKVEGEEVVFAPHSFQREFQDADGSRGALARVVGGGNGEAKRVEEVVSYNDLQEGDELVRIYDSEAG